MEYREYVLCVTGREDVCIAAKQLGKAKGEGEFNGRWDVEEITVYELSDGGVVLHRCYEQSDFCDLARFARPEEATETLKQSEAGKKILQGLGITGS